MNKYIYGLNNTYKYVDRDGNRPYHQVSETNTNSIEILNSNTPGINISVYVNHSTTVQLPLDDKYIYSEINSNGSEKSISLNLLNILNYGFSIDTQTGEIGVHLSSPLSIAKQDVKFSAYYLGIKMTGSVDFEIINYEAIKEEIGLSLEIDFNLKDIFTFVTVAGIIVLGAVVLCKLAVLGASSISIIAAGSAIAPIFAF